MILEFLNILTNVDLTDFLCHLSQVNWLTKIDVLSFIKLLNPEYKGWSTS